MRHRSIPSPVPRLLRLAALAAALLLFSRALPAAGESLAGKWSGTVEVPDPASGMVISTPIEVQLEEPQAGAVAGKIGREGENEAVPIRNGMFSGDRFTFDAGSAETTGAMKFTMILVEGHLEGQMKGAVESQEIEGKVKLTREKK